MYPITDFANSNKLATSVTPVHLVPRMNNTCFDYKLFKLFAGFQSMLCTFQIGTTQLLWTTIHLSMERWRNIGGKEPPPKIQSWDGQGSFLTRSCEAVEAHQTLFPLSARLGLIRAHSPKCPLAWTKVEPNSSTEKTYELGCNCPRARRMD